MRVAIDASNLRAGGGVTHLVELLRAADPLAHGFEHVVVWGGSRTIALIEPRDWLSTVSVPALDRGLHRRVLWQRGTLRRLATDEACDVLFVPGGADASGFRPMVTMSRNMLPFEWAELRRYGWTLATAKLTLLRFAQTRTLLSADGVIFLTQYARESVQKVTGRLPGNIVTIPHGLSRRFFLPPRRARDPREFTAATPCRLLYVSAVEMYKHQWHVVDAVAQLRANGIYVALELIGPPGPGSRRLEKKIRSVDPQGSFIKYRGPVSHDAMHEVYSAVDIGVFASSCENLPNILLEGMAAGLPFACSRLGPMPEVLGDAGEYFDPEDPTAISEALYRLIEDTELRSSLADGAFHRAEMLSWERCARDTFAFLAASSAKANRVAWRTSK